jgi:hypothetical protein
MAGKLLLLARLDFASMSYPMRIVVRTVVFRQTTTTLKGQGTGCFSLAEISDFRKQIWAQVSALLDRVKKKSSESGPFWVMGASQPTEVDTAVFGFIVSGLVLFVRHSLFESFLALN